MARGTEQKQKTLRLLLFLWQKTDRTHGVSMKEIIEHLNQLGIDAERKSVYSDIETLNDAGFRVEFSRDRGYRLTGRPFSSAELRLLVDAVQSSKFISEKTSGELISKLEMMTSEREASTLQRAVLLRERVKTENESVLNNVDTIQHAMAENKRISFQYFEWDVSKKRKLRHDGARYSVSPWALIWEDENYYLVAYDEQQFKHFRVDKMQRLLMLEAPRTGHEQARGRFDAAAYARQYFGMYGGEVRNVKLRFSEDLAGVMIDRFGKNLFLSPAIDGWSETIVTAAVSRVFFGWVMQFGARMQITAPADVRASFYAFVREILATEDVSSNAK